MARIPVHRVRGGAPKREQKTDEERAADRMEVFKKSGCTQQFPECPEVPDYNHKECHQCPFFPNKYKK